MKKWILIGSAVTLIVILAMRSIFQISNNIDDEINAYTQNLHYIFTARVDSVASSENGNGYLVCKKINGMLNRHVEDSLNQHLTNFKRMRFLVLKPNDKFLFVSGIANRFSKSDSISINSDEDKVLVFRNGSLLEKMHVSNCMFYKVNFAFWLAD